MMAAVAAVSGLLLLAAANFCLPFVVRLIQVSRWNRIGGKIALTYDDGPDSQTTVALLDLLDSHGISATFYLVGFRSELCPDVVARLKTSSHEIGSHSYNHRHAWKVLPWTEIRDSSRGAETLRASLHRDGPFRPPFGKISFLTLCWHWLQGRDVHWWCFDTHDTDDHHPDAALIAGRILESRRPVVLMHAHHPEEHKRRFVLELTSKLIELGRAHGVEFVTMNGLTGKVS